MPVYVNGGLAGIVGGGNYTYSPTNDTHEFAKADGDPIVKILADTEETLELYSDFTDASNYEKLTIKAADAGNYLVTAEAAGTGAELPIKVRTSSVTYEADGSNATPFFGAYTKSRGTYASPTDVNDNDAVMNIGGSGYINGAFQTICSIIGRVDSKGVGVLGGSLELRTANASGTPTNAMTINETQDADFAGHVSLAEKASAPSGVTNVGILYTEDNGAGKTRLMVQFQTGAAIQLAIEA